MSENPVDVSRERIAMAASVAIAGCVLVGLLVSIIWISWRNAAMVPISDEWSMGDLLAKVEAGTLSGGDLWAVHNEHRIVLSRLISLPVVLLLDWNRFAHLLIALAIVLISLALFLRAAWQSIPWRPAAVAASVPIVALCLSLTRFENWMLPFTDKIPTVFVVAICVWALSAREWRTSSLSWAISGAVVASLSSLGGLFVWLAFGPAVLVASRRAFAGWVVAAAVTGGMYFQGYAPSFNAPTVKPVPRLGPSESLGFLFAYLGAPIGYPHLELAAAFGVVGAMVVLIAILVLADPRWRDMSLIRHGTVWLGLAAFAGMSAGAILAGRGGIFGPASALYSRFHAFSSLWWIAAIVLTAMAVSSQRSACPTSQRKWVPGRLTRLNIVLLVCAGVGLVAANWQSAGIMSRVMASYRVRQGCVVTAVNEDVNCLAFYSQDTDALRTTVANLYKYNRGFVADTVFIASHGAPSAVDYALLPEDDQLVFRCGNLGKGGRKPDVTVSSEVIRTACDRARNLLWETQPVSVTPGTPMQLCVVSDWRTAGVLHTLQDGSQWCAIDWMTIDGHAASLVSPDGSIIVHAYLNNEYIPFNEGRPARRLKS
jgi:hypothetical protein